MNYFFFNISRLLFQSQYRSRHEYTILLLYFSSLLLTDPDEEVPEKIYGVQFENTSVKHKNIGQKKQCFFIN